MPTEGSVAPLAAATFIDIDIPIHTHTPIERKNRFKFKNKNGNRIILCKKLNRDTAKFRNEIFYKVNHRFTVVLMYLNSIFPYLAEDVCIKMKEGFAKTIWMNFDNLIFTFIFE